MSRIGYAATTFLTLASGASATQPVTAETPDEKRPLGEIVITAPYGAGTERDKVPTNVQSANAAQIESAQTLDLTEFLNRNFSSVSINHAQSNPLQPDVNFRGFTASPLLGLAPGLTVYQNGIRINEPFGDTVSWDLIPLSAVHNLQMLAGTNPVFGLNTLGGALSLEMKNGFNYEGTGAQVYGGSFERRAAAIEHGGNNGLWGYYGNIDYFEENGWRDFSRSDALRFFGALGRHTEDSRIDVSAAYAQTNLRGNGASPAELLAVDREQVFTHPDITENDLAQLFVGVSRDVSANVTLAGNVYYRRIDTDTFNGDGTTFEECDFDGDEFLVEDGFTDLNGDGECAASDDTDIEQVLDADGNPIAAELDDTELNAINNIGRRDQESHGVSAQLNLRSIVFGGESATTFGFAYGRGRTSFNSNVEVAALLEDRSTSSTGIFADELRTSVGTEVTTTSLYLMDVHALSDRASLTLSARYDDTAVRIEDRSGISPELDGKHGFSRLNPAAGLTYKLVPEATVYISYGESARAPTPIELACASEDAPCNLPNAFLADPPLEQVVAKSIEAGFRGELPGGLKWHAGAFHTLNSDDIIFQTTGGPQANVGFFANVGDTRRAGIELSLAQQIERIEWFAEYSLVDATFEETFIVNSPNHPVFAAAEDAPEIAGEGKLNVASGSSIPGIPRHQANAGVDYVLNDRFRVGADLSWRSGVYLRGDEANLLGTTPSYMLLNLRGTYRWNDQVTLFARVENALDEEYETFGLLGEPGEVFASFVDPRFYGAGPPFGIWVGARINLQ